MRWMAALCLAGFLAAVPLVPADAQATRTWVSGTGNDGNPCSRTQPCATFTRALAVTIAGGEINVLDPGDYGSVVIDKSVSIINDGAGEAGIVATTGFDVITINAGTTDVVNVRGLVLDNVNSTGNGITINNAGRVSIQNCVIQGFIAGVSVVLFPSPSHTVNVKILDMTIINNGEGVNIRPVGNIANVAIERSRIENNNLAGVVADGNGGGTVGLGISDSSISHNGSHGVIAKSGPSGPAVITLMRDSLVGNAQAGARSDNSSGGFAFVGVGQSMFAHNFGGAVQFTPGAQLTSFGTNEIVGSVGTGFSGPIARQ
jgi:hypothetical protein